MENLEQALASGKEEDAQQYLTSSRKILCAAFGGVCDDIGVIPKFKFGNDYVSDFVMVISKSHFHKIILIEIEPACEKPFTKKGVYAKRLNQAVAQITDWLSWIKDPHHTSFFYSSLSKTMVEKKCYS